MKDPRSTRIALFNANLARGEAGALIRELETADSPQVAAVAEIVQRVRPDILVLNELDHDPQGRAMSLFRSALTTGRGGARGIDYPHTFSAPINTGLRSGHDLDGDGSTHGPADAQGWGLFPGQFGMAVLSTARITHGHSFRTLLWRDAPGAELPTQPNGSAFYPDGAEDVLRLSSKSHWVLATGGLTLLIAHPTPPVFDGPEDRNGLRNAAEIGLLTTLVDGETFVPDDRGELVQLPGKTPLVVVGDLNNDPLDGDGRHEAIASLLAHPRLRDPLQSSDGAMAASTTQGGINNAHLSDPRYDTADWKDNGKNTPGNLRVDYVLPSRDLRITGSGVFWPTPEDPLHRLVGTGRPIISSDHRLVWVDIIVHSRD
ncbi:MAG: endonuclease/exonuclease/phosphatase family protein [Pseudomonadota bacterium]